MTKFQTPSLNIFRHLADKFKKSNLQRAITQENFDGMFSQVK